MERSEFVNQIKPTIQKYMVAYGYNENCVNAIVSQACCESANGNSSLASAYHNYFGLKCGSYWNGKSVNLMTMEEYTTGTLTQIRDNFRVYDSMDEGVKGYFDFISTSRYANLKTCTTNEDYLNSIKNDGFCTSSTYVNTCMSIVNAIEKEATTTQATTIENPVVGSNYMLLDNMNVRVSPSTSASKVGYNGLSADGKRHDSDKNGSLDKGTIVTCKECSKNGSEVWLRCPSGWVCFYKDGTYYCKGV